MTDGEWNSTILPEEGAVVYVLAADHHGRYEVPFQVSFARSLVERRYGTELEAFVAGCLPSYQTP